MTELRTHEIRLHEIADRLEGNAIATAACLRRADDSAEALQSVGWIVEYLSGAIPMLVAQARADGMRWDAVGRSLGMTARQAREKYDD